MLAVRRQLSRDAVPDDGSANRLRKIADNVNEHRDTGQLQEPDYSRWASLVERIRSGDERGMEDLYQVFANGVRFYLCRQLGRQDVEDKIHDTFVIVVQAIRKGDLREPERLMGFVRTIARRQVAAHIERTTQLRREQTELDTSIGLPDNELTPEEQAINRQRIELMKEVLNGVSPRDREILTRFYLREQTQEEICHEMDLSETQFRLLKSRAKARFGEIGKRKLVRRSLSRFLLRFSAAGEH
jgi:RNA polymerase sigma-70 factor, ECF subfamily